MRGLPYKVTPDIIQGFFGEICKLSENNIHIEEFNGKRSGAALIEFESEEMAQSAKSSLQKSEIEGRYIELFDHTDEFMRKVCKLE